MSVTLSGGRYCLVCGRVSILTVHRRCSRKFSARARSSKSALAGRGQQHGLSAEVAAVPASSFATDASLPRASCANASVASPVGSSTFVASLLDKPSVDDPMSSGQSKDSASSAGFATPHGGA